MIRRVTSYPPRLFVTQTAVGEEMIDDIIDKERDLNEQNEQARRAAISRENNKGVVAEEAPPGVEIVSTDLKQAHEMRNQVRYEAESAMEAAADDESEKREAELDSLKAEERELSTSLQSAESRLSKAQEEAKTIEAAHRKAVELLTAATNKLAAAKHEHAQAVETLKKTILEISREDREHRNAEQSLQRAEKELQQARDALAKAELEEGRAQKAVARAESAVAEAERRASECAAEEKQAQADAQQASDAAAQAKTVATASANEKLLDEQNVMAAGTKAQQAEVANSNAKQAHAMALTAEQNAANALRAQETELQKAIDLINQLEKEIQELLRQIERIEVERTGRCGKKYRNHAGVERSRLLVAQNRLTATQATRDTCRTSVANLKGVHSEAQQKSQSCQQAVQSRETELRDAQQKQQSAVEKHRTSTAKWRADQDALAKAEAVKARTEVAAVSAANKRQAAEQEVVSGKHVLQGAQADENRVLAEVKMAKRTEDLKQEARVSSKETLAKTKAALDQLRSKEEALTKEVDNKQQLLQTAALEHQTCEANATKQQGLLDDQAVVVSALADRVETLENNWRIASNKLAEVSESVMGVEQGASVTTERSNEMNTTTRTNGRRVVREAAQVRR